MNAPALLSAEWQTLQTHHEQHERNALLIKLTCVALCVAGLAARLPTVWLATVVSVLWLQEGIIKTYQSRLSARLLRVEALLLRPPTEQSGMQLHTEWEKTRPGTGALIASYALSALRPTVAYPYVPLLLLLPIAKLL